MTDLEYGNRSISSLVQELNNLGNRSVLIQPTELMAIQSGENKQVRRFQTKTVPKKQFFKFNQNEKKYFYSHVNSKIDRESLNEFMTNWEKGYNCTILLENNYEQIHQLLKATESWIRGSLVFCIVLNKQNELQDLVGQVSMTHRELLENKKYYEVDDTNKFKILGEYLDSVFKNEKSSSDYTLIDITFKNPESCAELHLTFLPSEMLSSECNPPFSLIKTQLIQILNYIKMNPSKRYEHISKLITKRLPMTNYLTKILMSDSCNLIVNFIGQETSQENNLIAKFEFFDKLSIVGNLLRKADRHVVEIGVRKALENRTVFSNQNEGFANPLTLARSRQEKPSKSNSFKEEIVSPIGRLNLKTENEYDHESEKEKTLEQKEFDFCRSLERKTHKFSISPREETIGNHSKEPLQINNQIVTSQVNTFLDKKTISKYDSPLYNEGFTNIEISRRMEQGTVSSNVYQIGQKSENHLPITEPEQIALLKAEHAREISQYHQTIQLLNKKIMILTKEQNLEELYKIHEREIMLLELKIKELRDDILVLTKDEPNEKNVKSIVKKLTEEVKSYENTSTAKKLSQGRMFMLEKELKETKEKLGISDKARAALTLEVETLTKRLKIRDSEIEKINQEDLEKYKCEELSATEEEILEDIKKLVKAVQSQERNSAEYLLRKISLILADLSKSRDIILECNDFLVQLMEILDEKLGKKTPEIVLDCNKFIRGFLMENLSIF